MAQTHYSDKKNRPRVYEESYESKSPYGQRSRRVVPEPSDGPEAPRSSSVRGKSLDHVLGSVMLILHIHPSYVGFPNRTQ